MKKQPIGYVVCRKEHWRDGIEESVAIFSTKEAALDCLDKWANGFLSPNCEFALYELGPQIDLTERVEETP